MLDRVSARYDEREICRRACKHWRTLYSHLVDLRGTPLGDVDRLDPGYAERPAHYRRQNGRRIKILRGPDQSDGGSWFDVGTGAKGHDVISLVQWLANDCDRRVAAEFLRDLTDRLVEVEVRV